MDGFIPPEDKKAGADLEDQILEVIKDHGCSYPAEIAGELGKSKDTIYLRLRHMAHLGTIKKVDLARLTSPPSWLKPRMSELWARGIKGDVIKRMSWYVEADNGENKVKK